jgi:hypothetical protein
LLFALVRNEDESIVLQIQRHTLCNTDQASLAEQLRLVAERLTGKQLHGASCALPCIQLGGWTWWVTWGVGPVLDAVASFPGVHIFRHWCFRYPAYQLCTYQHPGQARVGWRVRQAHCLCQGMFSKHLQA